KSLETLAKTARALGTNFLSICTGTRNPDNKWKWHPDNALPEAGHDLLITLERALLIADQYDVILGVEPEESNVIRNAGLARKLLDEMKSDRLKIIIDPANLFENADDTTYINQLMEEALELLHKDIAMAHAKDRSLDGAFRPAGRGDIDFDFFVNKLKEIGFEGPVVMHGLEENEVEKTVSYLRSLM
ncbi:MAG: sugar phosphate isomerase/epimerase, partial [Cyclobacteriaceae bacterium]|nr:sugar phosphate isomerase/epimerase [Cyclobacteriaceae bacterium]